MSLEDIVARIGRLGHEETPEAVADGLALLELVTHHLPPAAGRMASASLQLARDAVLAGKGPEAIEELRASVRLSWQGDLDQRFPNG